MIIGSLCTNGCEKKKKIFLITISAIFWGLLAHAYMFFNDIGYHDASFNFEGIGVTIVSGRWMLWIFRELFECLFFNGLVSLPWFNGIFSLIVLGVISYFLSEILEINQKVSVILLTAVLIVYPQVTCMFFYMYTAPYYLLGTLLGIIGVKNVNYENTSWKRTVVGIVLMACSVGTYQANIPVILCLIVLILIKKELAAINMAEGSKLNELHQKTFKKWVLNIFACIGFLGLYLGVNSIFLWVFDKKLGEYKEINTFGVTDVRGYINRIGSAYKEFFSPTVNSSYDMYPFAARTVYNILLVVFLFCLLYFMANKFRRCKESCLRLLILLMLFPLASNFIFVICSKNSIHGVMTYSGTAIFVILLMLFEQADITINSKIITFGRVRLFSWLMVLLICILYCRFSNMCYLKAELVQNHCVEYFENLASRIESAEGYSTNTPVVYWGEYNKFDDRKYIPETLIEISTHPYEYSSMINDYAWKETMALWTGFNPVLSNSYEWRDATSLVQEMPCYPKAGSIVNVNGVIFVKFANDI